MDQNRLSVSVVNCSKPRRDPVCILSYSSERSERLWKKIFTTAALEEARGRQRRGGTHGHNWNGWLSR